ncbi:MAG: hypothetical protein OYM47_11970 [Gemmatimonadota bacterium]|nr:hypothetical protein [Gemmatimonadota bacterium]
MIPLLSSLCYGPLEVCQLPRTWWKVLLRNANILDEEYPDVSEGLDKSVLEVLNLDRSKTLAYLRENMPGYLQFEAWVLRQNDGALDRNSIDNWNESVRTRIHTRPDKLEETTGDIGIPNDGAVTSAVVLNGLQDWSLFYNRDLKGEFSALDGRVVPLISSLDYGPLNVCQLPRTWLKILLRSRNLLHPDYPDMTEDGLDPRALRTVNVEPHDAVCFIRDNAPSYLDFEAWILGENDGRVDAGAVDAWNAFVRNRIHSNEKIVDIHNTLGLENDGSLTSAVVLNHIEDWHFAHADLTGGGGAS